MKNSIIVYHKMKQKTVNRTRNQKQISPFSARLETLRTFWFDKNDKINLLSLCLSSTFCTFRK
ncbi:MAG: hypothetical protein IPJ74_14160 [Saprospiraceae bacterium]|nr:hypothetical protein [Saprospiraceae bacterium]